VKEALLDLGVWMEKGSEEVNEEWEVWLCGESRWWKLSSESE
jgi:hypothetical protein